MRGDLWVKANVCALAIGGGDRRRATGRIDVGWCDVRAWARAKDAYARVCACSVRGGRRRRASTAGDVL